MNAASKRPRIAVLASFSGGGGVERMIANLVCGLSAREVDLDLLLVHQRGPHLAGLPVGVNIIPLQARHSLTSALAVARYLRRARPDALLAAKDRAGRAAVIARWLARVPVRLVIRIGTTVSASVAHRSLLSRWFWRVGIRFFYPRADAVIAVSEGVAADLQRLTGMPRERLPVVDNPVVDERLLAANSAPRPAGWPQGQGPVVIGVGRFTRQKDFPTLLRAFARLETPARLVILGSGRGLAAARELAAELGIAQRVSLPGFVDDAAIWIAHADLFVLSSRWEGSPNALTEALALGTPVVATDCPSGPREILRGGEVAPLVPVADVAAMAQAMAEVLAAPPDSQRLREAASGHSVTASADAYLRVLTYDARQT
ncbi:MAG: glycosyltransferase [Gammaproteobacteria bacterium]|jgi:glycosyltransferase involved in cell wall biosynthesis|nr:glycosyltransferase [Gammaproteobacteria bacterium]